MCYLRLPTPDSSRQQVLHIGGSWPKSENSKSDSKSNRRRLPQVRCNLSRVFCISFVKCIFDSHAL
uniref:Uncharacterized protein n=2 Tax=Arabidopsis thaliana TaxID=3702 RepID=Q1G3E0_ARATH|nr:unknown protein [Arabidopsis thaliana]BAF00314.1 hypothetical protein [Arabidopsis thaliana]